MLSEEVQMNIMSITKTVSDNIQEIDFNTIIEDMLGKNGMLFGRIMESMKEIKKKKYTNLL